MNRSLIMGWSEELRKPQKGFLCVCFGVCLSVIKLQVTIFDPGTYLFGNMLFLETIICFKSIDYTESIFMSRFSISPGRLDVLIGHIHEVVLHCFGLLLSVQMSKYVLNIGENLFYCLLFYFMLRLSVFRKYISLNCNMKDKCTFSNI